MAIMLGENIAGFQGKIYTCTFVQFLKLTPGRMEQSSGSHAECIPQSPM